MISNLIKDLHKCKEEGIQPSQNSLTILSKIFEASPDGLLSLNYYCGTQFFIKNKVLFTLPLNDKVIAFLLGHLSQHDEYIAMLEREISRTEKLKVQVKKLQSPFQDLMESIDKLKQTRRPSFLKRVSAFLSVVFLLLTTLLPAQTISILEYPQTMSDARTLIQASTKNIAKIAGIDTAALLAIETGTALPTTEVHNALAEIYLMSSMTKEQHDQFFSGCAFYEVYPETTTIFFQPLNSLIMTDSATVSAPTKVGRVTALQAHSFLVKKAAKLSRQRAKKGMDDGTNELDIWAARFYDQLTEKEKHLLGY